VEKLILSNIIKNLAIGNILQFFVILRLIYLYKVDYNVSIGFDLLFMMLFLTFDLWATKNYLLWFVGTPKLIRPYKDMTYFYLIFSTYVKFGLVLVTLGFFPNSNESFGIPIMFSSLTWGFLFFQTLKHERMRKHENSLTYLAYANMSTFFGLFHYWFLFASLIVKIILPIISTLIFIKWYLDQQAVELEISSQNKKQKKKKKKQTSDPVK